MKKSLTALAVASVVLTAGCSSSHGPSFERAQERVAKVTDATFDENVKDITPTRFPVGEVVHGTAYHDVNNYSFIEKDERNLPAAYDEPVFISANDDGSNPEYTVDEFAAMLYKLYGVILDVSSDDLKVLSAATEDDQSPSILQPSIIPQGVVSDAAADYQVPEQSTANKPTSSRDQLFLKPFKFEGKVRDMLDYVATLNGLKWKYNQEFGRAYLYAYETREFMVYDFSAERQQQNTITTTSKQQSESTQGGSSKSYTKQSNVKPWDELKDNVESMLEGSEYSSATFNEKTGMVIVKANDYTLSRVSSYIDKMNTLTTTDITVDYRMIRVRYSESDIFQINANFLNEGLSNNMFGDFSMSAGMGEMSPNISGNLSTLQELAGGNFLTLATDSFQGLFGYLNSVGTAELSYETQVNTPNNELYTHQGGSNEEYISSIERSTTTSSTSQENLSTKKDVAVDGISMTILPRIAGDQIKLDYDISASDFIALKDAGLGNGLEGIKLRQDSSLDLSGSAILENGVTRVVKVIHERDETTDAQGPIDKALYFFGGKQNRSKNHSAIIVTITAYYNNK
tara:strand:- start:67 stop:1779 length:1713 start_codon:yes stop_codon:yes gene_type:complete